MSKTGLIALEVNLAEYIRSAEEFWSRKAVKSRMLDGAFKNINSVLGTKLKRKVHLDLEKFREGWLKIEEALVAQDIKLSNATFYVSLMDQALQLIGAASDVVNNSFIYSGFFGSEGDVERLIALPKAAQQINRLERVVLELIDSRDIVEIGVLAVAESKNISTDDFINAVSEASLDFSSGEFHLFEFTDGADIFPSFINLDDGRSDGLISGNVAATIDGSSNKQEIIAFLQKVLLAHRGSDVAALEALVEKAKNFVSNKNGAKTPSAKKTQSKRGSANKTKAEKSNSSGLNFADLAEKAILACQHATRKEDETYGGQAFNEFLNAELKALGVKMDETKGWASAAYYDWTAASDDVLIALITAFVENHKFTSLREEDAGVSRVEEELYNTVLSNGHLEHSNPNFWGKMKSVRLIF